MIYVHNPVVKVPQQLVQPKPAFTLVHSEWYAQPGVHSLCLEKKIFLQWAFREHMIIKYLVKDKNILIAMGMWDYILKKL